MLELYPKTKELKKLMILLGRDELFFEVRCAGEMMKIGEVAVVRCFGVLTCCDCADDE